jgi:hypothetical protein
LPDQKSKQKIKAVFKSDDFHYWKKFHFMEQKQQNTFTQILENEFFTLMACVLA